MKTILFLSFFWGLPLFAIGQQLTAWSDYRALNYTFNPAALSFGEYGQYLSLDAGYRRQWTGFEDAPRTSMVGMQYQNADLHMAFGGFITNDQFGLTSYTQAQLQYAYQLQFDHSGDHILSIGIGVSATQFRLDGTRIDAQTQGDNLLADASQAQIRPNASIGLFYVNPLSTSRFHHKFLFAGFSIEQALPIDVLFSGQADSYANLKREPHYHLTLGTRLYYGEGYDYVEPVLWGKLALYAPANFVGGVRMTFADQRFWGGLSLTSAWEGSLQFGVSIFEYVQIGYAGSIFLSNTFSSTAGTSHEVRVSFRKGL